MDLQVCADRLISRAIRLDSGCLVLPNHEDFPDVYPSVRIDRERTVRANRLIWEVNNGPATALICHTCDYPRCFEITHLFDGTQSHNMKDMASKGRHSYPSGERAFNWQGGASLDHAAYQRQWKANRKTVVKDVS